MVNVQDGIIADLSEYQGTVDFEALHKVPNLKGVILRVQAGSTHADTKYQEYVAGCKKYGIPFGTYAYFKGVSVSDAIQEAKDAYSRMDKASVEFAVDIESNPCYDKTQLVPAGQAFIDHMKQQGLPKVGLYTGDYFFKPNGLDKLKVDFHWIAAYGSDDGTPHNAPGAPDDLWQFTSKGHIAGVVGDVDESVATGEPLSYFTGAKVVAPAPAPNPAPAPVSHESTAPAKPLNGWIKSGSNGKTWYYYVNGTKKTGWFKDKTGKWYYLDPTTGAMHQGWLKDPKSGKWYYLNPSENRGEMVQGWLFYNKHWYYLNPAVGRGEMVQGWVNYKGKWYFMNRAEDHGEMLTGTQTIMGKTYHFAADGHLL